MKFIEFTTTEDTLVLINPNNIDCLMVKGSQELLFDNKGNLHRLKKGEYARIKKELDNQSSNNALQSLAENGLFIRLPMPLMGRY